MKLLMCCLLLVSWMNCASCQQLAVYEGDVVIIKQTAGGVHGFTVAKTGLLQLGQIAPAETETIFVIAHARSLFPLQGRGLHVYAEYRRLGDRDQPGHTFRAQHVMNSLPKEPFSQATLRKRLMDEDMLEHGAWCKITWPKPTVTRLYFSLHCQYEGVGSVVLTK